MAIVCIDGGDREVGQAAASVRQVLDYVRTLVALGVSTMDLERAAEKKIKELGGQAGVQGVLRLSVCARAPRLMKRSCTAPVGETDAKEGDIVSIDWGGLDGSYGDAAITARGNGLKPELQKLLEVGASSYRGTSRRDRQLGRGCWRRGAGPRGAAGSAWCVSLQGTDRDAVA